MSMQDDSPEYGMFVTISRVRSTEKTYMFSKVNEEQT